MFIMSRPMKECQILWSVSAVWPERSHGITWIHEGGILNTCDPLTNTRGATSCFALLLFLNYPSTIALIYVLWSMLIHSLHSNGMGILECLIIISVVSKLSDFSLHKIVFLLGWNVTRICFCSIRPVLSTKTPCTLLWIFDVKNKIPQTQQPRKLAI